MSSASLARNVRRIGHLDLPGAGQVCVSGGHAYVGHIPSPSQLGTSIVDVSDPKNPRVASTITLDDPGSHSHKARAVGDILIVNHERNMSKIGRRAEQLPAARRALADELKREPTRAEIAARMSVTEDDLSTLEEFEKRGYDNGGFKIYDVSDACATQADLLPEDRRHRRPPLRHGCALCLYLDRDGGLRRHVGMAGAWLVAVQWLHVNPGVFIARASDTHSPGFSWARSKPACWLFDCGDLVGSLFAAGRCTRGVGLATTRAVVQSAVAILIANYILAALLTRN